MDLRLPLSKILIGNLIVAAFVLGFHAVFGHLELLYLVNVFSLSCFFFALTLVAILVVRLEMHFQSDPPSSLLGSIYFLILLRTLLTLFIAFYMKENFPLDINVLVPHLALLYAYYLIVDTIVLERMVRRGE